MAAISEQKRNYSQLDHRDWVRWWNAVNDQEGRPDKNIDFHWADIFPIRTPTVLRAVLVKPNLVGPLCKWPSMPGGLTAADCRTVRGCWEKNLDMSNDDVLRQAIDDAGHNGSNVLQQANNPQYKAELRSRTQEAKDAGICGVPSYRVYRRNKGSAWKVEGDIVWGQVRTESQQLQRLRLMLTLSPTWCRI